MGAREPQPYASVTLLGFAGHGHRNSMVRHAPGEFAVVGPVRLRGELRFAVLRDEELKKTELPVFFGRDQEDPVIPQEMVNYT